MSFAYLFERFPSFVQTFVYREALEMTQQGMEPWLVSIRRPDDPAEFTEAYPPEVFYLPDADEIRAEIDRLRTEKKLPGAVHRAIPEWRQKPDSNRLFEAAWLGPRLKERGIRHIHAHFSGVAARTAWLLRKLYGFTYSFTGHANDIFCETNFPISNADLVRDAELIVTETDYARDWMQKNYPRAHNRIARVYNGVSRETFLRQTEAEPPRILSVGRLVEKKGFGDLIEACRVLREKGRAFECSIVGDGPLETKLRAKIAEHGLGSVVTLLGAKPQSQVARLLAESQLFVLACVPEAGGGSDNLPTAIMEAMMCGVPVISTRVAGIPEMIQHSENGLLVAPGKPETLAGAMEQLLRDGVMAAKLGQRGHGTAQAKFAIEKTTRALKHLLVQRAGVVPPPRALELDPELPRPSLLSRLAGAFR